jgi:hypothetical protein
MTHANDNATTALSGAAFLNACRILNNLDCWDLEDEGIMSTEEWHRFIADPMDFMFRMDNERFAKLWAKVQERQPAQWRDVA